MGSRIYSLAIHNEAANGRGRHGKVLAGEGQGLRQNQSASQDAQFTASDIFPLPSMKTGPADYSFPPYSSTTPPSLTVNGMVSNPLLLLQPSLENIQKKGVIIDKSKHRVLSCNHPSPLSASKGPEPFLGSGCFKKANEALVELGHGVVDWNVA